MRLGLLTNQMTQTDLRAERTNPKISLLSLIAGRERGIGQMIGVGINLQSEQIRKGTGQELRVLKRELSLRVSHQGLEEKVRVLD